MKTNYLFLALTIITLLSCKRNTRNIIEVSKTTESVDPYEVARKTDEANREKLKSKEEHQSLEERVAKLKSRRDSINSSLGWKQLKQGLWQSKKGDLGFKRKDMIQGFSSGDVFITNIFEGEPLSEILDLPSFRYLGSSFYKDKNHIYTFYEMAGGGNFRIVEEADVNTFRVLGDCYAKDSSNIYGERAMKMSTVDYKTFKTCKGCGCYAKDKNGYYFWDERISDISIEDQQTLLIINKLDK